MLHTCFCRKTERDTKLASAILSNGVNRLEVNDFEDCETLADLLDAYREQLNIPADANIAVNGEDVNADEFDVDDLEDGDLVSATKVSGSKG
jgi:hypothetical protein